MTTERNGPPIGHPFTLDAGTFIRYQYAPSRHVMAPSYARISAERQAEAAGLRVVDHVGSTWQDDGSIITELQVVPR